MEGTMQAILESTKTRLAVLLTGGMLAVGLAAAPAASAQQQGLVNVDVHNVLNDNHVAVTVPVNAAANICNVDVGVLTTLLATGPQTCTARGGQELTISNA
jgi:hypothetical protein